MRNSDKVQAAWLKYNANSKNKNSQDCVLRSMSLAYNDDYDAIHNEMNRLKRKWGFDRYNEIGMIRRYLAYKGFERCAPAAKWSSDGSDKLTLQQFTEIYPEGTYFILCGKAPGSISHAVCVIDGDIYDSWNSSEWFIYDVHQIKGGTSEKFNLSRSDDDMERFKQDIISMLDKLFEQNKKKMDYADFMFQFKDQTVANSGLGYRVRVIVNFDLDPSITKTKQCANEFVFKLNPRKSYDEQSSSVLEKARVAVREYLYMLRKQIQDIVSLKSLQTHPKFVGDRELLLKLPEWSRGLIQELYDYGANDGEFDRYYCELTALPDDPRSKPVNDNIVTFYADTITSLKYQLERYKKDFRRFGYDY